jgi:hypothetical protein
LESVIFHEALFPQRHEDVGLCPLLETAMGGTVRADTCGIQSAPLAPSPQDEENGIHGFTIIDPGAMAPQRVRFPWWKQGHNALPQLIWDTPVTAGFHVVVRHQ